jgi:hypothetical protein
MSRDPAGLRFDRSLCVVNVPRFVFRSRHVARDYLAGQIRGRFEARGC